MPVFAQRQKLEADGCPIPAPLAPISPSARASCSVDISFTVNRSSLHEISAGVQQINNAVQEVNDLARKNKDSIEGLAAEVGKFKV